MGHQAGIPTLNQGSQLDSWLGRETLAGEPEKLKKTTQKTRIWLTPVATSEKMGTCPGTWRCCVEVAAPGTLGVKGVFGGLSAKGPWMSRLEPSQEEQAEEEQEKATDSLWKWLCSQVISQGGECHQVFWEKWEEIFSTWRPVRNKILNSTGKSLLHRTLIQTKRKASSLKPRHSKDDKERSL